MALVRGRRERYGSRNPVQFLCQARPVVLRGALIISKELVA